jgi:hypothetical protein
LLELEFRTKTEHFVDIDRGGFYHSKRALPLIVLAEEGVKQHENPESRINPDRL